MTLILEEIPLQDIARVLDASRDVQIAKTLNKAVLGTMNELILNYKSYIEYNYASGRMSASQVVKQMNRIPWSFINGFAIEKFREHFGISGSFDLQL